jgi:hypothetical protein
LGQHPFAQGITSSAEMAEVVADAIEAAETTNSREHARDSIEYDGGRVSSWSNRVTPVDRRAKRPAPAGRQVCSGAKILHRNKSLDSE